VDPSAHLARLRAAHDVFDHPLYDLTTREREALRAANEAWLAA
jgi:hypothetical protein